MSEDMVPAPKQLPNWIQMHVMETNSYQKALCLPLSLNGDLKIWYYCVLFVGARVVKKLNESEKVGVFAILSNMLEVVEYSEMTESEAGAKDASGEFVLPWGNICMHYFTVKFLETIYQKLQLSGKYHVARKKIPSVDGPVDVSHT